MLRRSRFLFCIGLSALVVSLVGCPQARTAAASAQVPSAPDVAAAPETTVASDPVGQLLMGLGPDIGFAQVSDSAGLKIAWETLGLPWAAPALPEGAQGAATSYSGGDLTVNVLVACGRGLGSMLEAAPPPDSQGRTHVFGGKLPKGGYSGVLLSLADGDDKLVLATSEEPWDADEAVARIRATVPVEFLEAIGEWARTETASYDPQTIMDYIDGAAERHLRYGFERLYQARYAKGEDKILVDAYLMRSGPDAYGLFSCLEKGSPFELGQLASEDKRTLYAWIGCYYVEIRAATRGGEPLAGLKEVAATVVRELGPRAMAPDLVRKLGTMASDFSRVRFFHEPQDQANYFYLSTTDVLHLGPSADGVLVMRGDEKRPEVLVVVRYGDPSDLEAALADTLRVVEKPGTTLAPGEPYEWDAGHFAFLPKAEDLPERIFVGVFDSTTPEAARKLAEEALACLK